MFLCVDLGEEVIYCLDVTISTLTTLFSLYCIKLPRDASRRAGIRCKSLQKWEGLLYSIQQS